MRYDLDTNWVAFCVQCIANLGTSGSGQLINFFCKCFDNFASSWLYWDSEAKWTGYSGTERLKYSLKMFE